MQSKNVNGILALTAVAGLILLGVLALPVPGAVVPADPVYERGGGSVQGSAEAALREAAGERSLEYSRPSGEVEVERQLERCREAAQSGNPVLVRAAAEALGELDDPRARPILTRLLARLEARRDEPAYRCAAAALARYGDERGIRALVELSRSGGDRYLALLLLSDAPGSVAGDRLTEVLRGTNDILKGAAVRAVARRRQSGYENALGDALASPDWGLREAAVSALRDTPVPGLAPRLGVLLHDPSESIRVAAAGALALFDDPRGISALEDSLGRSSPFVRFEAARLLMKSGRADALPHLVHAYRALSAARRQVALSRLAGCCPVQAADFVAGLLSSRDPRECLLAASALVDLADRRAFPVLVGFADSEILTARADALVALSRLLRRARS